MSCLTLPKLQRVVFGNLKQDTWSQNPFNAPSMARQKLILNDITHDVEFLGETTINYVVAPRDLLAFTSPKIRNCGVYY